MNNKGFTTIEIVLSFALVVIILASLTGVVIHYRDQVTTEEVKTKLLDYKNTITKVVYDDIITGVYKSIEYCIDDPLCVNFVDNNNNMSSLRVFSNSVATNTLKRGMFVEYHDMTYMLPDSDLNEYNNPSEDSYIVNISDFILQKDDSNGIYKVIIPIYHRGIDVSYNIVLIVS